MNTERRREEEAEKEENDRELLIRAAERIKDLEPVRGKMRKKRGGMPPPDVDPEMG